LKAKGYTVGLASSKPEHSCIAILEDKGVAEYFDYIVGASLGPERREKALVLREAFARMQVKSLSEIVLVGDTKYDAAGAVKEGIDCIGITYGFGSREELFDAGAVAVFDTLAEVEAYLDESK
jgi:phosphoglycolate phosphatase